MIKPISFGYVMAKKTLKGILFIFGERLITFLKYVDKAWFIQFTVNSRNLSITSEMSLDPSCLHFV